jgi:hypothetical protein
MKKLAILVSLVVATPVFACPHDDASAPKTAEKAKEPAKEAPAKEQPKKEEAKPAETAKAKEQPKKDEPKKPTKVSQK